MSTKIIKATLFINFICFFLISFFSFTSPTTLFTVFGREFQFSFYISIFAIPFFYLSYFFLYKKRSLDRTLRDISIVFLLLFISSIGMSFFYYQRYGGLFGTTPPQTVIEEAIKYAYDLSMLPYFIYMISLLNKKVIERTINIFILAWILFGLFQLVAFYINSSGLWQIYDAVDILKCIAGNSALLERIRNNYGYFRFYGISSEPAANAILIDAILLPYLVFQVIRKRRKISKAPYALMFLFVLLFGILTISSAVYVGLLIDALYIIFVFFTSKSIKRTWKILFLLGVLGAFTIVISVEPLRNIFWKDFIQKIFGKSNYSTQYRYSTVWNDLCCFAQSPLFGVGDGLQGLFYAENISNTWMAYNSESQAAIKGERGLLSGGAGIPSIISGFGIFGVVLIIWLIVGISKRGARKNVHFSAIKHFYLTGLFATLVLLTVANGIHRNVGLILVLTLPYISMNDSYSLDEAASAVTRPYFKFPLKFIKI